MLSTVILNVVEGIWDNLDKVVSNSYIKGPLEKFLYFLYGITFGFCLF